jgi:DNA polymerase III alpha subunit (gram-positive type)
MAEYPALLAIVYDTETTSLQNGAPLDPATSRIVQLAAAAVKIEAGEAEAFEETFETFVALGPDVAHVSNITTALTGIEDADLQGAPSEEEALDRMGAWIRGMRLRAPHATAILVAHNGKRFDDLILARVAGGPAAFSAWLQAHGVRGLLDTVDHAKALRAAGVRKGEGGGNRLIEVYRDLFGEKFRDQHTAGADVQAIVRILGHKEVLAHPALLHDHIVACEGGQ